MATSPLGEKAAERRASVTNGTIEETYDVDEAILRANGHTTAMKRQFNWLAALGLGFSITNSWVGYLSNFGQNLNYGGTRLCLIGLLVAFLVQFTITLGLSEIASAFPSSGGQYHFCYIIAPEKTRRFAAYTVGWISLLAWWIVTCSGISLFATTLSGTISAFVPNYGATQWQIYLIYIGTSVITVLPVILSAKHMSLTVQLALYISLLGFLLVLFVPTGMHQRTQPSNFIFGSGIGTSGWSPTVAWLMGISNAMYAFGGTDGAIHISEEMTQPGRRVPQVMISTMVIGLCTAFPLMLALLYFVTDLDAVTKAPLPSLELLRQATGNDKVAIVLISVILLVYCEASGELTDATASLPSQWVSSGRLAWAFARDNGVPYSAYFSKIDERLQLPLRTTVAAFIFACLYGLLYLASTTAFNSIITSAVLFLNVSYAIPQGILLFEGRARKLPPRYLNLGMLGYFCNVFSILWIAILGVLVCMPPTLPVTVESMNYTSVVLVGLMCIVTAMWLSTGRKVFQGPQIDWDQLVSMNSALVRGENVVI